MGATAVVDASAGDPVAAVRGLTGGRGADYGFEVVGRAETIRARLRHDPARRHDGAGRGRLAGRAGVVHRHRAVRRRQDAWSAASTGRPTPDRDFPVLVDLVRTGAIDAEGMVTRRIGLDDVNDAFRAMEAGEVARSVIVFPAVRRRDRPGPGRRRADKEE